MPGEGRTRLAIGAIQIEGAIDDRRRHGELGGNLAVAVLVFGILSPGALEYHLLAMMAGQCMTAFFAVWTVHHGCSRAGPLARAPCATASGRPSPSSYSSTSSTICFRRCRRRGCTYSPAASTPRLPKRASWCGEAVTDTPSDRRRERALLQRSTGRKDRCSQNENRLNVAEREAGCGRMRIIAVSTLRAFWARRGRHDAEQPLRTWVHIVKAAQWSNPAEVKGVFRSADILPNERVVFNIGGNKVRLDPDKQIKRPSRCQRPPSFFPCPRSQTPAQIRVGIAILVIAKWALCQSMYQLSYETFATDSILAKSSLLSG